MTVNLADLYQSHVGKVSDKWSSYLPVYEETFASLRNQKIRLLEIGIQNGGSLEIYSQYFPCFERLVGCDVNPDCKKLKYQNPHIRVVVGDANTDETENRIVEIGETFDIILDDGSHKSTDIVRSFARYWRHLRPGGVYLAEDLHCSYWQEYGGGLYDRHSSISFFKALADIINHEHWGLADDYRKRVEEFARIYHVDFTSCKLDEIHSIQFFNSICVVKKMSSTQNLLGKRVVAGQEAGVVPMPPSLHGSAPAYFDQSKNPNSTDPGQTTEISLKLFVSPEADFKKSCTTTQRYYPVGEHLLTMQLPDVLRNVNKTFIRLEPADRPGLLYLRKITLKGRNSKGQPVMIAVPLNELQPTGDLLGIPENNCYYFSLGNNPVLLFPPLSIHGMITESINFELSFKIESPSVALQMQLLQKTISMQSTNDKKIAELAEETYKYNSALLQMQKQNNEKFFELGSYFGKIQDIATSSLLNYMPATFSFPLMLFRMRGIKKPRWLDRNKKDDKTGKTCI